MNIEKIRSKTKALLALKLFALMMLLSGLSFAATHNIVMEAVHVFNGQPAYKMVSHTSSDGGTRDGGTHNYPVEATIPGPTLFVKEGDVINIELTNNSQTEVGFLVPALSGLSGNQLSPGQSGSFQFNATTVGTHAYGDAGSHMTGLFGAIIVDRQDGKVQSFIDGDGTLTPVNQADLKKEFVMFMVGSTFWGTEISNGTQKPLWTNPTLGAILNDVVRFHIVGIGHAHTFHLHAHRWPDETNFEAVGVDPHIIDAKILAQPFDTSGNITVTLFHIWNRVWRVNSMLSIRIPEQQVKVLPAHHLTETSGLTWRVVNPVWLPSSFRMSQAASLEAFAAT